MALQNASAAPAGNSRRAGSYSGLGQFSIPTEVSLILIDAGIPPDAVALVGRTHASAPAARITLIQGPVENGFVQSVRHLGLAGCLAADALLADLQIAIRKVAAGQTFFSACYAGAEGENGIGCAASSETLRSELTRREREVAACLREGMAGD